MKVGFGCVCESLILAMALIACGGGEAGVTCQPNDRTICREGAVYWVDSCGQEGNKAQDCECGCNADFTACEEDCGCVPDCAGRLCGPDPVCQQSCGECLGGQTCVDGACVIPCNEGETRCAGDVVETCTDNAWVAGTDCDQSGQVCVDGDCIDVFVCEDGETRCAGDVVETCIDNAWVAGTDCDLSGQVCVDGQCVGGTTCPNGETRCDGTVIETCYDNTWVAGTDCANSGQTCADGQCVGGTPCPDGQTRCDGTVIETCMSNTWIAGTDCAMSNQTCSDGQCVGGTPCPDGETRCDGTVIETCMSNTWIAGTDCAMSAQVCVDGSCEGNPTPQGCPTAQTCADFQGAGILVCTEGGNVPVAAQSCDPQTGCDGNFFCFPLGETEAYCLELCGVCPAGQECVDITATGMRGCLEDDNIPPGAPSGCDLTPCEGNATCYIIDASGDTVCIQNFALDGPCAEGATRCVSSVRETCESGVWTSPVDCSAAGQLCLDGACVEWLLCPLGLTCVDVNGGKLGCLDDGEVPAGAPTGCDQASPCEDQFSCWSTTTDTVCLEDCGTCSAGQDCENLVGGYWACTDNGGIPAGAPACDPSTFACPNPNAKCWSTGDGSLVCLDICSAPH